MKIGFTKILQIAALSASLAGCTHPVSIHRPEPYPPITKLCIINNPDVFGDGFLPALKSQLKSYGITTQTWTAYNPDGCRYWLEYTANWRLSLIVTLYYAELKLYDHTILIGGAVYDDTGFGFHHEGSAEGKLKELTEPLFAQRNTLK